MLTAWGSMSAGASNFEQATIAAFAAALGVANCGPSTGSTPAGPPPLVASSSPTPSMASASAPASASSEAPDASPPPPAALPAAPPGTDPEKVTFAASICAAAYLGKDVGCRSHPPFVKREQQPDGRIVEHQGDPLSFCAIDGIFKGSFTRPGAKQAVVSFSQCKESEDATWDMGFPGSAVLAEEIDGRWKAVGYEPDVNTGFCLKAHRADGRDVLLCRSNLAAPPSGDVNYVFVIDFARAAAGKRNSVSLAKVFGDFLTCMIADQGLPSGLVSLAITKMTLKNLDNDGTDDLVVKVRRARVAPSPKLDAKFRALCHKRPDMPDMSSLLPAPKETTLEFVSDADGFSPTPSTQKTLDAWKAESPDGFNGLMEVGPPLSGK